MCVCVVRPDGRSWGTRSRIYAHRIRSFCVYVVTDSYVRNTWWPDEWRLVGVNDRRRKAGRDEVDVRGERDGMGSLYSSIP